jgi:hypothetical protein
MEFDGLQLTRAERLVLFFAFTARQPNEHDLVALARTLPCVLNRVLADRSKVRGQPVAKENQVGH